MATQRKGAGKGVAITDDNLLFKKILKEGDKSSTPPPPGVMVTVHYTGKLMDGTVFDSSVQRNQPFTFQIGVNNVILGWDKGVATMKVGEKCVLTCSPEYGYGGAGAGGVIPPNATLQFEVELLSYGEAPSGIGMVLQTLKTIGVFRIVLLLTALFMFFFPEQTKNIGSYLKR